MRFKQLIRFARRSFGSCRFWGRRSSRSCRCRSRSRKRSGVARGAAVVAASVDAEVVADAVPDEPDSAADDAGVPVGALAGATADVDARDVGGAFLFCSASFILPSRTNNPSVERCPNSLSSIAPNRCSMLSLSGALPITSVSIAHMSATKFGFPDADAFELACVCVSAASFLLTGATEGEDAAALPVLVESAAYAAKCAELNCADANKSVKHNGIDAAWSD